jgi:hypothetical protein
MSLDQLARKRLVSKNEVLMIRIPGTVIGVGIQDQLGIGHVVNEMK